LQDEVGIKRRPFDIHEIDEAFFAGGEEDDDVVPLPEHDGIAS
jgi:hypothetical protein